jgi:hypothetical protein
MSWTNKTFWVACPAWQANLFKLSNIDAIHMIWDGHWHLKRKNLNLFKKSSWIYSCNPVLHGQLKTLVCLSWVQKAESCLFAPYRWEDNLYKINSNRAFLHWFLRVCPKASEILNQCLILDINSPTCWFSNNPDPCQTALKDHIFKVYEHIDPVYGYVIVFDAGSKPEF